jgi:hypothetical protein
MKGGDGRLTGYENIVLELATQLYFYPNFLK